MKRLIVLGLVAILAGSCTLQKEAAKSSAALAVKDQDSTEYEILIIDPYFDTWYTMNYSPALDRTNENYRTFNQFAVLNWNNYFNRGRYRKVIDSYIYYEPARDYGIEVNRKLYWYFKYIESTYRIPLFR